jgi:hypothetical protein
MMIEEERVKTPDDVVHTYKEAVKRSSFKESFFTVSYSGLPQGDCYEEVWLVFDISAILKNSRVSKTQEGVCRWEPFYGVQTCHDGSFQYFSIYDEDSTMIKSTSYDEIHEYIIENLDKDLLTFIHAFIHEDDNAFDGWSDQFKHVLTELS